MQNIQEVGTIYYTKKPNTTWMKNFMKRFLLNHGK